jgi:hypothetical protein
MCSERIRRHQWEEELEEGELKNFVPKSTKLKNDEQLIFLFCQPTSILCVILAHTLLPHLRIFVSLPELPNPSLLAQAPQDHETQRWTLPKSKCGAQVVGW